MRIGFVKMSPLDNPEEKLSGVTSAVQDWIPALGGKGHKASVFALKDRLPPAESRASLYVKTVLGDRSLAAELENWIEGNHIDLLHLHTSLEQTFRIVRRPLGCAVVQSTHTFEPVCPLRTNRLPDGSRCESAPGLVCVRSGCRSLAKFVLHDLTARQIRKGHKNHIHLMLTHNQELLQILSAERSFPPLRYVPLGIHLERFPRSPDPGGARIFYAGRLRPEKGVDRLIRSMVEVHRQVPESTLSIAGSGEAEESLRSLAARLGLGEVVDFLGAVPRGSLADLHASSVLTVVPSVWEESFGFAGVEAMACGRPVIASDVSGIREWLTAGEDGVLVPPGDVNAICDAAVLLLKNAELRRRMGRAARKKAEAFDVRQAADELLAMYREAMSIARGQPHGSDRH